MMTFNYINKLIPVLDQWRSGRNLLAEDTDDNIANCPNQNKLKLLLLLLLLNAFGKINITW